MKFNRECMMDKICSDDNRVVLKDVYLKVEEKKLIATDGKALAVIPCEPEEGDVSGYVPKAIFQTIRKLGKREYWELRVNGDCILESSDSGTVTLKRPENGPFPNYERVLPSNTTTKDEMLVSFCLDLKILKNLADAMGTDRIVLTLKVNKSGSGTYFHTDPVGVKPMGSGRKEYGVIMPMRTDR